MSVLGAFNAAVSGMNAQSNALSSISQNIANTSTVGYEAVQTDFEDQVLAGSGGNSGNIANTLGGVSTTNRLNTTSGQITSTGVSTDLAVDGNGYLIVNTNSDSADGTYLATLAGSFRPDAKGNLANAAGYYLQGIPLDSAGNPVGGNSGSTLSDLSTVNINAVSSAATATSSITFGANLPSTDTAYSATTVTPPSTSVTYYDALGTSNTLTMSFTPSQAAAAGNANTNTWTMNIYDSASSTPTTPVGTATVAFNPTDPGAGSIASVTASTGTYDASTGDLSITTASGTQIALNIGTPGGTTGLTQYDGSFQTTNISSDGSAYGTLSSVSISKTGIVDATFSNGSTIPIYQLELATVPNVNGLTQVSGDAFAFTPQAGTPTLANAGSGSMGNIDGSSLESSNVDITAELTNLIETQRAYNSNATVIQTGNQMLQTAGTLDQGG